MKYQCNGYTYEDLYEVICENGLDVSEEFDDYMNENYTASQFWHAVSESKWYHNDLTSYIWDEVYPDFVNNLAADDDWLEENEITTVDDDDDE